MTSAEIALSGDGALDGLGRAGPVGLGTLSRLELARISDRGTGHRLHGNRRLQRNPTKTNAARQRERQVEWEYVHVCVDDATRLA